MATVEQFAEKVIIATGMLRKSVSPSITAMLMTLVVRMRTRVSVQQVMAAIRIAEWIMQGLILRKVMNVSKAGGLRPIRGHCGSTSYCLVVAAVAAVELLSMRNYT